MAMRDSISAGFYIISKAWPLTASGYLLVLSNVPFGPILKLRVLRNQTLFLICLFSLYGISPFTCP
jgi:hypothetical protein